MTCNGATFSRKDALLMGLLVLTGLCIRLYFLRFYDVISSDGISYVSIAKDFISGRGLAGATHYPPFFPILTGLASTVTRDFEPAGLAVSIVMGSLLAVPVYLLGAEFFDRRIGFVAAFFSITWPTLRFWSVAVMSQATYITLLLLGVYCLWCAYRRESLAASLLSGVLFGCAHLTRSEGVLVFFGQIAVLTLFTFVNRHSPGRLRYLLFSLIAFFVVFSPYLVMLHDLTGKWQLTGKSKVAIADALSDYLEAPDMKHDPTFKELGYLDLLLQYPHFIRNNLQKNLATVWKDLLPLYGWLLAFFGFLVGKWDRERWCERAFLLASFAPLVVIVVFFFVGPEYTQEYLPVLFLYIANALFLSGDWAIKGVGTAGGGLPARYGWWIPVCLGLGYGAVNVVQAIPANADAPYDFARDEGRYDEKRIGLKLGKTLPESAVLMTRSGRIGFYSGRKYLTPPQTDYAGILDFARRNKIGFLVATPQLLNTRPQLEFLFGPILEPGRPFNPPPELELIAVDQLPGGIPYILYRFR